MWNQINLWSIKLKGLFIGKLGLIFHKQLLQTAGTEGISGRDRLEKNFFFKFFKFNCTNRL